MRSKLLFLSQMELELTLSVGVNIVSLFAVLNKVAGVYGILAVFTGGAEGLQLTMYLYSILSLFALVWGIKMVHEVRSFRFSHRSKERSLTSTDSTSSSSGERTKISNIRSLIRIRSLNKHSLDYIICSDLVRIHASRWEKSGKL